MKIVILSGSRADRNALEMVRRALVAANHRVDFRLLTKMKGSHPDVTAYAAISAAEDVTCWAGCGDPWPPDLLVLHGDRHEILGAAMAANMCRIPIAHIGGGDITEGSQDDCFRHAITKLSHLHFPSNEDAGARIIQMGEQPDRVHVTGCPGLDMVRQTPTLTREQSFAAVGLPVCDRLLLVAFHPNTLGDTAVELDALSGVLQSRGEAIALIGPNADAGNDLIRAEWIRLAEGNQRIGYYETLSPQVFYSLMAHCNVMIGNSSAGFYEAPFFGTPVINIGERQTGRPSHARMLRAAPHRETICRFVDFVLSTDFPQESVANPYGDGHSAERIARIIGDVDAPGKLLRKRFNDLTEFIPRPVLEELPY